MRLVYRNSRVNTDPASLIIVLGLPAMYLVFFGYGFQSLIPPGESSTRYLEFLAPGIMAFQAVMAGTLGGSMLWADRRWGMLAQLLVGPFTRSEYLFGIMITSLLWGLGGAAVMLVIATVLLGATVTTVVGGLVLFGVIALGSIFFGSLMLLLAAYLKSNTAYNSVQILLIFVVNFSSTVFYPYSTRLPVILRGLFLVNPLTFVADTARSGYSGTLSVHNGLEVIALVVETAVVLLLAVRAYLRSDVSLE